MLINEIKRLKMKTNKFENLGEKILKLDTYRRIALWYQKFPHTTHEFYGLNMFHCEDTNENVSK